ncbi:phosphohydrolase [Mucilaginibacter robiniae]|uniref:Phosphohydrolase n=1 Tax=Mucilaginibacter robiniae TaxID=2728022 RepID=A0A7L5E1X7_9SPHI|nr:Pycsar system effector family protein [Mucilaginibacter robiniae]QJD97041.1 phosphohydrolase [Mucilaginibacter robiniae]
MDYQRLLEQVKQHVLAFYKKHNNEQLTYHNRNHTEDVVHAVMQIGNHYQLNDRDFFIVTAAAWFHDMGYQESMNNHEEQSAQLAEAYLKTENVEAGIIDGVKQCILATRMPQQPSGLLQQIICDADLFHLGTDDFAETTKELRKEINTIIGCDVSKQEWRQKTVRFLESHHYHTDYCQLLLNDGKQKNLEAMKTKIAEWDQENSNDQEPATDSSNTSDNVQPLPSVGSSHPSVSPHKTADLAKTDVQRMPEQPFEEKKSKKKERPDKGIETMFRVSSSNHQRLSDMADNKAHIMITVNSIILSAIISLLLRRLEDYSYLIIPTIIILAVSLTAMVFSILSTRPSIPGGTFTQQDVDQKKVNLLFFGNFYRMNLQDYIKGMQSVMADREYLYGSLIIDVYSQGVVLGKKYRLLRIAYNVFMFGLIISVLAFIIAAMINGSGKH